MKQAVAKSIMAGGLLSVLIASLVGSFVLAANRESFLHKNGIIFLDSNTSLSTKSCQELFGSAATGSLSSADGLSKDLMEIKDADKLAWAIDEWVRRTNPRSPFVGLGKQAVMGGQRSGINPILPIIIARKESQLGLARGAGRKFSEGHNAYGRTASRSQPHVATSRLWYKWQSLEDSLFDKTSHKDDMYAYLKRQYADTKTIDELMMRYAPPHENNTQQYLQEIKRWANEIYDLAGQAIDRTKLGATTGYDDCVVGDGLGGGVPIGELNMFYQHKGSWARQLIGKASCVNSTFAQCGCGPTSLAIAISNLTGNKGITPLQTRDLADFPAGISHQSLLAVPRKFGLRTQAIGLNISRARQALSQGAMVILSQNRGFLTPHSDGHIMVIRGMTADGKFLIADPANERHTNNRVGYDVGQILGGAKGMWVVSR